MDLFDISNTPMGRTDKTRVVCLSLESLRLRSERKKQPERCMLFFLEFINAKLFLSDRKPLGNRARHEIDEATRSKVEKQKLSGGHDLVVCSPLTWCHRNHIYSFSF